MRRALLIAALAVISLGGGCGGGTKDLSADDYADLTCQDLLVLQDATHTSEQLADLPFPDSEQQADEFIQKGVDAFAHESEEAATAKDGLLHRALPKDVARAAAVRDFLVQVTTLIQDSADGFHAAWKKLADGPKNDEDFVHFGTEASAANDAYKTALSTLETTNDISAEDLHGVLSAPSCTPVHEGLLR